MDTKEKLEIALKEALKAGDDVRKRTVRMVLAAVRQVEIDRQVKLDEAAVLSIIQKEIKTRRESVEEARGANRPDIVAATEAEIVVLQAYLPAALSADELKALVGSGRSRSRRQITGRHGQGHEIAPAACGRSCSGRPGQRGGPPGIAELKCCIGGNLLLLSQLLMESTSSIAAFLLPSGLVAAPGAGLCHYFKLPGTDPALVIAANQLFRWRWGMWPPRI